MEKMLNIKINNIPCSVPYGTKIIDAARMVGIEIPTLCYLKEMNEIGACRFCVVEVVGARSLVAACVFPIERDGTEIFTPHLAEIRPLGRNPVLPPPRTAQFLPWPGRNYSCKTPG